jgi:murein DD-endopeptidase MepM/ murein hydrolase activator NlpD
VVAYSEPVLHLLSTLLAVVSPRHFPGRAPRTLLAVVAVASVLTLPPAAADELEDELAEVNAELDAVAASIEAAEGERSSLAADVIETTDRVDSLLVRVAEVSVDLAGARQAVSDQQIRIAALQDALDQLNTQLAETRVDIDATEADAEAWARQLYMTGGSDQALLILTSHSLSDVGVSLEYLSIASRQTDRVLLDLETLQRQEERWIAAAERQERILERQYQLLREEEQRVADLLEDQVANQAAAEAELASERSLLSEVEEEIAHFEGELASLEAEQDRIRDAINAEASPDTPVVSTSGWARPVPGPVTSGFGPRLHPILGHYRMHTGWDMSAGSGDPISAAASGTVILAGPFGGYGNCVVVDHGGGVTTLYAHQTSVAVSYGARVSAGDVVGYVGSTGLSTGPHLHFEVRVGGNPVDPSGYL